MRTQGTATGEALAAGMRRMLQTAWHELDQAAHLTASTPRRRTGVTPAAGTPLSLDGRLPCQVVAPVLPPEHAHVTGA
jgi:hypothetical protein